MRQEYAFYLYNKVFKQCKNLDKKGRELYGRDAKRYITFKQEMVFRLCHHDFFGLSAKEAAEVMQMGIRSIYELLKRIEAVAPQLFPILTPYQAKIYRLFVNQRLSPLQISHVLNIPINSIYNTILNLIKYKQIRELNRHLCIPELWLPSNTRRRLR
jgi:hypothetical protein